MKHLSHIISVASFAIRCVSASMYRVREYIEDGINRVAFNTSILRPLDTFTRHLHTKTLENGKKPIGFYRFFPVLLVDTS